MASLREACTEAGFTDVSTVLATGNVLFRAGGGRKAVLARLRTIVDGFGLDNAVVLRTPAEIEQIVSANPFPDAVARGSEFAVFFLAEPAKDTDWMAGLTGPERLHLEGIDLYVDYSGGVSASPLTPAKIEKRLGVVTTFRNWNTVMKLHAAAGKLGEKAQEQ